MRKRPGLEGRARGACALAAGFGAVLASAGGASAQPATYNIFRAGLYDGAHTFANGNQVSRALGLNIQGDVLGESLPNNGAQTYDPWLFTGGATVALGLTDALHTRSDGYRQHSGTGLSSGGMVIGASNSYNGASPAGATAWRFDHGTYVTMGLLDAPHIRASDGYQFSRPRFINSAGTVAGYALRFVATDGRTEDSAWLYSGGVTTRIGLFDAVHTSAGGAQMSDVLRLNEQGQVLGFSQRYGELGGSGLTTWLRTGNTYAQIGLFGAEFQNSSGAVRNSPLDLTDSGFVSGLTERHSAAQSSNGLAGWVYDGHTTVRVGFFDAAHTGANNRQETGEFLLSEAGVAAGVSTRYIANEQRGGSAWAYSAGTTTRIGFFDALHTAGDGTQSSSVFAIGAGGGVLGTSARFSGVNWLGDSVWVYQNGITTRVGLVDAAHTSQNGSQFNTPVAINSAGDAIGHSVMFAAPGNRSGWYFDHLTGISHALEFGAGPGGEIDVRPVVLTDNGIVLGSYGVTPRLFWWSLADGFYDLGGLVDGGLTASGWTSLASVYGMSLPGSVNGGTIAGIGRFFGQENNGSVYVLTQVPGTSTAGVLIGAMALGFGHRRSRKATHESFAKNRTK